jgi:hypothetical protein
MGKKKSFLGLFRSGRAKSKKTNTVRTEFYRGHLIKRNITHQNNWSVHITDKTFVGKIEYIKMSIDQWCDNKVIVAPEYFERHANDSVEHQIVDYKGHKIINDLGGSNDWYVIYRGKLMKGSRQKIEKALDQLEEKALLANRQPPQ